jgi:thioredoxin-related protein
VYASFKINQQEIADTICVQRKLLFNNCNGRCELQKSLKKYADNEKKMHDSLKEKAEIIYIQNTTTNPYNLVNSCEAVRQQFADIQKETVSISVATFRPPSSFI